MTAILLLCYKRIGNIEKILEILSKNDKIHVYINIDGPKNDNDKEIHQKICQIAKLWVHQMNLTIFINRENLGVRKAIPKAINKVFETEDKIIVIEDDVIPENYFYKIADRIMNEIKYNELSVGHVSFYNCVPIDKIKYKNNLLRKSQYPESYAWGTWKSKWELYDDAVKFENVPNFPPSNLKSYGIAKLVWRINHILIQRNILDSWAYRWIFSLWNNNQFCANVNTNLVNYVGQKDGTHTITKQKWKELEPSHPSNIELEEVIYEDKADEWLSKIVFNHSMIGIIKLIVSLCFRKIITKIKSRN